MSKKSASGILLTLLALSMSLLAFNIVVEKARAEPNPWQMPVVYFQTSTPAPNTLQVDMAIYNLSDHFWPTDEEWAPGQPLGEYQEGPVARYNYTLGNIYTLDISISWNPAVLSYASHVRMTGVEGDLIDPASPGGILHNPILNPVDTVDAVAGTYRIGATSYNPAVAFNAEAANAKVFSMVFAVLGGGDNGLTIDSVDLWTDQVAFPLMQPKIPWRTVMHDVEVKKQTPNKNIVGSGYGFSVEVDLENQGDYDENFQVTAYLGANVVGTLPTSATARSTKKVTVACTASVSIAKGTYELRIVATLAGDDYLENNDRTEGTVFITIAGDVNGNRAVNIFDIVTMAGVYGKVKPDPAYNPYCDLNNDGKVDIFDIVIAAGNYGKSW